MAKKEFIEQLKALPDITFGGLAQKTLDLRILKEGESFQDMCKRVSSVIANSPEEQETFELLLRKGTFMCGSPFLVNAGGNNSFFSCFVIPIEDSIDGIFNTVKNCAKVQACYGGLGVDFTPIRPKDSPISTNPRGKAAGVVAFMDIFNTTVSAIKQGDRPGALMAMLSIKHPDILEYIDCKLDQTKLNRFNISIAITDDFMEAVENDDPWDFDFNGDMYPCELTAREIWAKIIKNAHANGEPGVIYIDTINAANPNIKNFGKIKTTNPCFPGDSLLHTHYGYKRMIDCLDKDELKIVADHRCVMNVQKSYNATGVIKTRDSADVYEVTTEKGYKIHCTKDHMFPTIRETMTDSSGKPVKSIKDIELKDLNIGDDIMIYKKTQNKSYGFNNVSNKDTNDNYLASVLGYILCRPDRFIRRSNDGNVDLVMDTVKKRGEFSIKDVELLRPCATLLSNFINQNNLPKMKNLHYFSYKSHLGEIVYNLNWFKEYLDEKGFDIINPYDNIDILLSCSLQATLAWLRPFISFCGYSVGKGKHSKFRLMHESKKMLETIQMVLLDFGVMSSIGEAKPNEIYNGVIKKGTVSYYNYLKGKYEDRNKQFPTLTIEPEHIDLFLEMINWKDDMNYFCELTFARASNRANNLTRRDSYFDKLASVKYRSTEPVYCLSHPNGNHIVVNGIVTHNCGESPLLPYESCNLGSIVLPRILTQTKHGNYQVDYKLLTATVHESIRFLDNAMDKNQYPIPEIKEQSLKTRKIGLGVMGLSDMLIMLGIDYGSKEAYRVIDQVMGHIRREALTISSQFGNNFNIDDGILPRRMNSTVTSVAPTGTISIISGVSSGIEPIFKLVYNRKIMDGKVDVKETHPLFLKLIKKMELPEEETLQRVINNGGSIQGLDDIFSKGLQELWRTTNEIPVEAHIKTQSIVQKHVCMGVSKTINLPKEASLMDVEEAFMSSWKGKCKGITVYRDGSRDSQPISSVEKDKPKETVLGETWCFKTDNGRPRVLDGKTYKIRTPQGQFYLTINAINNHPLEVFCTPHADGYENAVDAEAICRLISLGLRNGVKPEDVMDQLSKVKCQSIVSLPRNITNALSEFLDKGESEMLECKECGAKAVIREAGCEKCLECGFSVCG